jgi:hypothetical protein
MRNQLLAGKIELPGYDKFASYPEYECILGTLQSMFQSCWRHYCANEGDTSLIYWTKQAGPGLTANFLGAVENLYKSGWVEITYHENYSSIKLAKSKLLEYVSDEELTQIRFNNRFEKYLPHIDTTNQNGKAAVFVNGQRTDRKLDRSGMEVGAKSTFTLDQQALFTNLEEITAEANKGMLELFKEDPTLRNDEANYGDIVEAIVEYLVDNSIEFNMGVNNCDSRGRAIKSHLSKVMNPVGFKVTRALLVVPE